MNNEGTCSDCGNNTEDVMTECSQYGHCISVRARQRQDWQALVDYLKPFGNGACLNSLLEDGPDDVTDFEGLLRDFKAQETE